MNVEVFIILISSLALDSYKIIQMASNTCSVFAHIEMNSFQLVNSSNWYPLLLSHQFKCWALQIYFPNCTLKALSKKMETVDTKEQNIGNYQLYKPHLCLGGVSALYEIQVYLDFSAVMDSSFLEKKILLIFNYTLFSNFRFYAYISVVHTLLIVFDGKNDS